MIIPFLRRFIPSEIWYVFCYIWPFNGLTLESVERDRAPFLCCRHDVYITLGIAKGKIDASRRHCNRTYVRRHIELVTLASKSSSMFICVCIYLVKFTSITGISDVNNVN